MPMLTLTGLNGESILVAAASVFRVRATTPFEAADAIKVEYGGGYLLTLELMADLLARLAPEVRLIALTSRSGTKVHLAAAAISRVRDALAINGPGTEIVVAGHYQHVVETVAEVTALLP